MQFDSIVFLDCVFLTLILEQGGPVVGLGGFDDHGEGLLIARALRHVRVHERRGVDRLDRQPDLFSDIGEIAVEVLAHRLAHIFDQRTIPQFARAEIDDDRRIARHIRQRIVGAAAKIRRHKKHDSGEGSQKSSHEQFPSMRSIELR